MLPDEAGTFHARSLLPFLDDVGGERRAHLFRTESPVGFALVDRVVSGPHLMSELFVVRGARRRGLGRAAVDELFALYPGVWEIPFQEENADAARFWRRVAAEVGESVSEEPRPVPGKPLIPPDVWLTLTI